MAQWSVQWTLQSMICPQPRFVYGARSIAVPFVIVCEWRVVDVGLTPGVDGVAVAVHLDVLESAGDDLALPVDLAAVGDSVVEVDEKPRLGRLVLDVEENGAPVEGVPVVG